MKYIIAILFLQFTLVSLSHSQDLQITDNPYESAGEITKSRKAFQRERWFYEQRMYPGNSIPDGAYEKAVQQRNEMRSRNGVAMTGVFDTWASLGPTTGFYFNYSNISSRMTSVKYDPSNPNIIYAGAAFGGVWKSTNAGSTWVPLTDGQISLSTGSIAIDPVNTNVIYYGTGEATYSAASYYGRGLLKSTDGGITWKNFAAYFAANSYCSRIAIRPGNSSQLLAAMGVDGLYRTTDAGESWNKILSGRCDDVVFSPSGDTAYIVGSGTGYGISYNGGASFSFSGAISMGTRNHIAVCITSPSVLYFARYSGSSITVFKSANAGQSFSQIAAGQSFSGSQAWYDFYMHVNPHDANYAYVGSIDIWRTTNGGASNFTNITNGYSSGNVHVDQHNIDFHPADPNQMLCVNDGGIWRSTNRGTNWTNLNTNQTLTQFYRIASDPSNAAHILGGTQDNGTQRTTGALNWAAAFGGDGGEVCFHAVNNSYILGETQNNGVYRSTNGGASFSSSTSGLSGSAAWVSPILSHPDSAGIFYTARQTVYKSTSWGTNWFSISSGTSGTIREMAICRSAPQVMYATSGSSVFRSTNRGYSYTNVTSGLPSRTITSVSIHPDSANVVILSFSGFGTNRLYKTTNSAATWFSIGSNLPDAPINDALFYYPGSATPTVFAATDVGVFVSDNYGASWLEAANGLPNTVAIHLDYHASSNKLRVGTHGRGVFEIQLASFTPVDVASVDAGVSGIQIFSSSQISPAGTVKNLGNSAASFTVTRKILEDGTVNTVNVNSLAPGAETTVIFPHWSFIPGMTYTVVDSVHIAGDINSSNDISRTSITPYVGSTQIKLREGYGNPAFPPGGWSSEVLAGTSTVYWSRSSLSSNNKGTGSALFRFFAAPFGSRQALVSPVFNACIAGDSLEFDIAYAANTNGATDSVIVEASANSGAQYSVLERYWGNNAGGNMNTAGASSYEFFPTGLQWKTLKLALPAGTNRVRFISLSGTGNNFYLDSIRVETKTIFTTLNITTSPEGFLNTGVAMNSRDTMRAYLRSVSAPYLILDSAISVIDSASLTAPFTFASVSTGYYYIQLKHRNSLETWSKAGGEFIGTGSFYNYSFISAITQAYGSNQSVSLSGIYSLYSGDVNDDDVIDGSDLLEIENAASLFSSGYVTHDLDGNFFVDATDALIADNNAFNIVSVIRP